MRDFLALYIDRVTISPRKRRGHDFEPSGVKITWR
jgi:hypothetical protein